MGITRKLLSVSTIGAVDFRSDKERTAAAAKGTKRETKKLRKAIEEQNKLARKS